MGRRVYSATTPDGTQTRERATSTRQFDFAAWVQYAEGQTIVGWASTRYNAMQKARRATMAPDVTPHGVVPTVLSRTESQHGMWVQVGGEDVHVPWSGTFKACMGEYEELDGRRFKLLRVVTEGSDDTADKVTQFEIEFADGEQMLAWPEEVEDTEARQEQAR